MVDVAYKLAYFQAITGLEDLDLCMEILQAHNWDLELTISSFTSNNTKDHAISSAIDTVTDIPTAAVEPPLQTPNSTSHDVVAPPEMMAGPPGLVWKVITLPILVIYGSLGLISGVVGFGLWVAGGILLYSLGFV